METTKQTQTQQAQVIPSAVLTQVGTPIRVIDLIGILFQRKGAAFMSFESVHSMDDGKQMRKTKNPHFGLGYEKHKSVTALVTFDYDKALQTRSNGEEEAVNNGNTWQKAVTRPDGSLTPLTVHKDDVIECDANGNPTKYVDNPRIYLRCERRSSKNVYVNGKGEELDSETVKDIKTFMKQYEERTVEFITVSFANIRTLKIDGETYHLVHEQTATAHV